MPQISFANLMILQLSLDIGFPGKNFRDSGEIQWFCIYTEEHSGPPFNPDQSHSPSITPGHGSRQRSKRPGRGVAARVVAPRERQGVGIPVFSWLHWRPGPSGTAAAPWMTKTCSWPKSWSCSPSFRKMVGGSAKGPCCRAAVLSWWVG